MINYLTRKINSIRVRYELRNQMESSWLRDYFRRSKAIDVGLYSYGCFDETRIPPNTVIGRYCSFSQTCCILNGNHGLSFVSLHPYLYNVSLGLVSKETIKRTKLVVEDDVWVGHNAIILPSVKKIGRGSVIAAGAIISQDVEPYSIVAGVPAKQLRKRFSQEVIQEIEATEWWQWNKEELKKNIQEKPEWLYNPSGA